MEAEVVSITAERSCRAALPNDILVVFQEPPGQALAVSDRLRFVDLALDSTVQVVNMTSNARCEVYVASGDVHDLRLPARHGTSRTITLERLHAH